MKITKRQLKKIIQEEKAKLVNEISDDDDMDVYMEAMQVLYDDLVLALTKARKARIEYTDFQTVLDDAQEEAGYQEN